MANVLKGLSVRVDAETMGMITEMTKRYDFNTSQLVRDAIREKFHSEASKADGQLSARISTKINYLLYLVEQIRQAALDEQLAWIEKLEKELMKYGG